MTIKQWQNITNYMDTVGTTLKTFTFNKTQNFVQVTVRGNDNVTYSIGSQSGTLTPGQSKSVSEKITSFTLTALSGTQTIEVWATEDGTLKVEDNGASLDDTFASLATKANQVLTKAVYSTIVADGIITRRPDDTLAIGNGVHQIGQRQGIGEDWNTFGLIDSYIARGIPAPTLDVPTIAGNPVSGGSTLPYNTTNVTLIGCYPVTITSIYASTNYIQNQSDTRAGNAAWAIEFQTDASNISILLRAHENSPRLWLWVDGKPVGRSAVPDSGVTTGGTYDGQFNYRMTWTTSKTRVIRLYMLNCDFGGISYPTGNTVTATTPVETKKAVFLGDSWFDMDTQQDFKWPNHIPTLISLFMGWQCMNNGISATGYVNPGSYTPFGSTQRLAPIYSYNPDYIVISGSINDDTQSNVGTAATNLYNAIATNLPNAKIFVVGRQPVSSNYLNNPPQQYTDVTNAAKNASNVLGFIDPMRERWFTGGGSVNSPIGYGNADWYVGYSTTHPSNVGSWYYSRRIAEHILRLLNKNNLL